MKIKIQNTRLSFPSLFKTARFGDEETGKYEATFILNKKDHADVIKQINAAFVEIGKEKFKGKLPPEDKRCLKDGDQQEREELKGSFTIKASTKKRPLVIDKDKSPITEADEKIYAGCHVHAIITIWAQDNQYGKRLNAQLDGVQFFKDGEPFSDNRASADEFDAFGEDDF